MSSPDVRLQLTALLPGYVQIVSLIGSGIGIKSNIDNGTRIGIENGNGAEIKNGTGDGNESCGGIKTKSVTEIGIESETELRSPSVGMEDEGVQKSVLAERQAKSV
ncbi:hypothetical protein EVAR_102895_1 [Eumeta japonica]|uniref:Uncharacterized protein n=1 Tax=Eumeta variegata TaxID=151549 RepID=A0A4C1ZNH8_EUMVA|nr:hypothetical protein EVAR_102895_1 [Eumeta japonica]